MAEIINLRRVRKRLARDAAAQDAATARTWHSRNSVERQSGPNARMALDRTLDQARLGDQAKLDPSARDGEDPK